MGSSKYLSGPRDFPTRHINDRKTRGNMKRSELKFKTAAEQAEQAEMLLTESAGYLEAEGLEKTYRFTQEDLKPSLDMNTKSKAFDLQLPFGPYRLDYTNNGRNLLIGGKKGHVASFDWKTGRIACELQLQETVRDVQWLHNEIMFAVAQKREVFLYDNTGAEIHRLGDHIEVNRMDFLSFHFLLGKAGYLKYRDCSTGGVVAEHRTGLGNCEVLAQNRSNAIVHLGHANGTVTLWSPSSSTPLVKMLCHRGPVKALAIDNSGRYMATSGMDSQLKIFDIRTFKPVHEYFTTSPANCLSISDTGAVAVGHGPHVNVWKDALRVKAAAPYMTHLEASDRIQDVRFCPYEDILGIGTTKGFRSLVIPGTGEANFDSMEANPYQTKSQRQESEVHGLLEKIQPEMITLDPSIIGNLDRAHSDILKEEKRLEWEANNPKEKFVPKHKQKGRSSAHKRFKRKQANVIDSSKREYLKARAEDKNKEASKDSSFQQSMFSRFAVGGKI